MGEQEVVIVVTVPTDLSHLDEVSLLVYLEDVDGLVLDGEDCQGVLVQVEALVVGEEDLVNLEGGLIAESALLNVDHVEGVVLQRVPGVGADALVVPVLVVHRNVGLLGDEGRGADDDEFSVIREERALSVELLVTRRDTHGVLELEEPVEHDVPDPLTGLAVVPAQELPLRALEKVGGSGRSLVPVDLQRGLVGAEGDEPLPVRAELPQEAGRLEGRGRS